MATSRTSRSSPSAKTACGVRRSSRRWRALLLLPSMLTASPICGGLLAILVCALWRPAIMTLVCTNTYTHTHTHTACVYIYRHTHTCMYIHIYVYPSIYPGALHPQTLQGCHALERLVLYRNRLSSLGESLRGATRLTHLDLGRNSLQSAQGLQACTRLESLILYENEIASFHPREAIPGAVLLRHLWLNGNRLTAPPRLSLYPFLQVCLMCT